MASRYDGRSEAPLITRRRHVLACARCRARRVKCDRAQPACSNCVKVRALCQSVQNIGPSHSAEPSRPGSREPVEQHRLARPEDEIGRLSREVDSRSPSRESSHSPAAQEFAEDLSQASQGRIVQGGRASTYISPYSWAAAAEEVIDIDALIGEGLGEDAPRVVNEGALPLVDDQLHETLLGVFSHRVDPIIRILHWPTFLDRCRAFRQRTSAHAQTAAIPNFPISAESPYHPPQSIPFATAAPMSNVGTLQPGSSSSLTDTTFATLVHAVYFASLVSIINSPNPPDLGENVNAVTLWSAFKRQVAARISKLDGNLARADSTEMLQAMVLHMSVELGATDCQLQWLQLGTAIRMARTSGLHRDPSNFGFDPIEIEIRRRLWAQICILDTRLAEQLCREPTITPDSYDIILPLSLSDQELVEIDRHAVAFKRGQANNFTTLQDVEQGQQHVSKFSCMTLLLVEAEVARQQQQLLCFRSQPRDHPFSGISRSPQLAKRATSYSGRLGRVSWVGELQERYMNRYQWDRLNSSDPMQHLVSEVCQINILKAAFINRLAQRKEASGPTSTPSGHSETVSIFHDALQLAMRCAAVSRHYSTSPYYWFARRIREANSCSFLALVLASELPISPQALHEAWAVMDQLFVPDNGQIIGPGLQSSFIGKVLAKARLKRSMQAQIPTHQFSEENQAASRGYSMHVAQYPPISSPTNIGHAPTFHASENLFEDWDALIHEPVWTGSAFAADQSYWV